MRPCRRENTLKNYFEHECEFGYRNTSYTLTCRYFLDLWNLPYGFLDVVGMHHTRSDTGSVTDKLCRVLNYTDRLITALSDKPAAAEAEFKGFHVTGISPAGLEKAAAAITRDRINIERELNAGDTS